MLQAYEATLLSPLSYRTRADSGAGGASVTGAFLGDIALSYAIHHSRYGSEDLWDGRGRTEPRYKEDYEAMRHRCSVGMPVGPVELMPIEYQATSFVSEGYPQVKALKDSAQSSMKNWMQRQSIAPRNKFEFIVASKGSNLPTEFTIRMGNGRETLVKLREIRKPESCTLNAFTITNILARAIPKGTALQMENSRYLLVHGVKTEEAERLIGWPAESLS